MNDSLPQGHDVSSTPQPSPDPGDSGLRWTAVVVLAVLLVVCVVLIVLEVTTLRPKAKDDKANQEARSQAISAAERFTVQVNTFDGTDLRSYRKSVKSMISPKFQVTFDKTIQPLAATYKQGKVKSKGEILKSAVASQDSDSAQVLVVSDSDVHTIYEANVVHHFRWQISLVKINGRWLVDDFEPVR